MNKGLSWLIPTASGTFPLRNSRTIQRIRVLLCGITFTEPEKRKLSVSFECGKKLIIPKRTYSSVFSFVISSLIYLNPVLTIGAAIPPAPNRVLTGKFMITPKKYWGTRALILTL
jgi:hypothetical protein